MSDSRVDIPQNSPVMAYHRALMIYVAGITKSDKHLSDLLTIPHTQVELSEIVNKIPLELLRGVLAQIKSVVTIVEENLSEVALNTALNSYQITTVDLLKNPKENVENLSPELQLIWQVLKFKERLKMILNVLEPKVAQMSATSQLIQKDGLKAEIMSSGGITYESQHAELGQDNIISNPGESYIIEIDPDVDVIKSLSIGRLDDSAKIVKETNPDFFRISITDTQRVISKHSFVLELTVGLNTNPVLALGLRVLSQSNLIRLVNSEGVESKQLSLGDKTILEIRGINPKNPTTDIKDQPLLAKLAVQYIEKDGKYFLKVTLLEKYIYKKTEA